MYYIIFDCEWTYLPFKTGDERTEKMPNEIIQIGAVKADKDFNIIDTFKIDIKPVVYRNLLLGDVSELTGITNNDLKLGFEFNKAIKYFKQFIGIDYLLCAWTHDDFYTLKKNCDYHNIETDWITRTQSIQKFLINLYKLDYTISLQASLGLLNIKQIENQSFHNALSNSLYTLEIFKRIFDISFLQNPLKKKHRSHCPSRKREKINYEIRHNNHFDAMNYKFDKRMFNIVCPNCKKFCKRLKEYIYDYYYKSFGYCYKCNLYICLRANIHFNAKGIKIKKKNLVIEEINFFKENA